MSEAQDSWPNPPTDGIVIGDGHVLVYGEYQGEPAGVTEWHRKMDGTWCRGWLAFKGSAWANSFKPEQEVGWDVLQKEPLTLSPSILCRACGSHGYIREGKWVQA